MQHLQHAADQPELQWVRPAWTHLACCLAAAAAAAAASLEGSASFRSGCEPAPSSDFTRAFHPSVRSLKYHTRFIHVLSCWTEAGIWQLLGPSRVQPASRLAVTLHRPLTSCTPSSPPSSPCGNKRATQASHGLSHISTCQPAKHLGAGQHRPLTLARVPALRQVLGARTDQLHG